MHRTDGDPTHSPRELLISLRMNPVGTRGYFSSQHVLPPLCEDALSTLQEITSLELSIQAVPEIDI